jgi:hypothetical protein
MNIDYLKILITIIMAVIGWIVGYYFTTRKDINQKRRDISIEHLINAYRILTNEISHRKETKDNNTKLENILSDMQLFGSEEQVQLAKDLADTVAAGGEFQLDPLINSLRNDLRKMIGLKKVKGNVKWLRYNDELQLKKDNDFKEKT